MALDDPRAEAPDMADYGVGRPTWRALPWSWAAARLAANKNYWVVTASVSARPHAMPVWGVWDEDERRFAFSCSPRSRKARNLSANPQVTFATESTEECLSVEGWATLVVGEPAERWIERYVAKYAAHAASLTADFVRSHALFEVTPERAFAVIERDDEFADRATRWVF